MEPGEFCAGLLRGLGGLMVESKVSYSLDVHFKMNTFICMFLSLLCPYQVTAVQDQATRVTSRHELKFFSHTGIPCLTVKSSEPGIASFLFISFFLGLVFRFQSFKMFSLDSGLRSWLSGHF